VILTNANPPEFEQTLERLRNQGAVDDPEIIIMNSSTRDLSHLTQKYGAKVWNRSSDECDRPGKYDIAEHVTGEYVFIIAGDAIPASNHLLRDFMRMMQGDSEVAIGTARQIPRTDADLMSCVMTADYYRRVC
jgi:GT2 family glycosyltransferase